MLAGAQRNSSLQCGWEGKKEYKKKKSKVGHLPARSASCACHLQVSPDGPCLPGQQRSTAPPGWGCFSSQDSHCRWKLGHGVPKGQPWPGRMDRNRSQSWAGAQGAHGAARHATPANLHLHHARTPQWAEDCINSTLSCCV